MLWIGLQVVCPFKSKNAPLGSGTAGFTLLEVLVALTILVLAVGSLSQAFSGGINTAGAVDGYTRAVAIAESRLARIGVDTPLEEGQSEGDAGEGFRWSVSVQPYELLGETDPSHLLRLYDVEVAVSWGDSTARRSFSLRTLKLAENSEPFWQ